MRGYFSTSERAVVGNKSHGKPIAEILQQCVVDATGAAVNIRSVRLYYVRQTNGEIDGRKVVYYFEPEFVYLMDIGMPRLALVAVPYQVPTVKDGWNYRTIGRGDGDFPEFTEASVFSCAGYEAGRILYSAAAGELIVGAKDGVTEEQLRAALASYVNGLSNESGLYVAKVTPFDEDGVANKIMSEVDLVRYASLNTNVRSTAGPWWVDQLL